MRSMVGGRDDVKSRRGYNATLRTAHARRNRDRIVDVAERLFLSTGYGPTTIGGIADEAGASVDTIDKSFGGKPRLGRAIRARALRGEGPVPAEQRSDELQAREPDPRRIIEAWGKLVTEIAPRTSPLLILIRGAARTDPELRGLLREMDADRLRRMTENARRLHAAGHLRSGITIARAADVMWTYSSPELYELLVTRRGMPLKRYGNFGAGGL